jgi:hypothetical protein
MPNKMALPRFAADSKVTQPCNFHLLHASAGAKIVNCMAELLKIIIFGFSLRQINCF